MVDIRCVSCSHRATQLFVPLISATRTYFASERPSPLKDTMLAAGHEKNPCLDSRLSGGLCPLKG